MLFARIKPTSKYHYQNPPDGGPFAVTFFEPENEWDWYIVEGNGQRYPLADLDIFRGLTGAR